jgi:DNA replication protein DnaC
VTAGKALFRRPTVAASRERPYAPKSTTLSPAEPRVEPSGCTRCYGAGMEIVPGKGARRCACHDRDSGTKLFEREMIPRRYADCTLSNFRPESNNTSHLHAFRLAHRLVRDYPAVERGLLFTGPCGVGKTHPSNYPCRTDSCAP